ncbi:MAG: hypothetical protein H6983_09120 [Ectothiorhodospiraceae bacterium]|nr:hypothetical protein [Planctomycetota bacterium]MCP5151780.1 hypothetical protein [Chromatiales bacterium]MCP5154312.1 hypothetical protein [Ectothiorhodospiraceae bacterium]
MNAVKVLALGVLCTVAGNRLVAAAETPIAGTQPGARPAGAPVVSTMNHDGEWYARALTGLAPPYPRSFRFLEDQGAWYTPFDRPGMTGRYDIRGWHTDPEASARER